MPSPHSGKKRSRWCSKLGHDKIKVGTDSQGRCMACRRQRQREWYERQRPALAHFHHVPRLQEIRELRCFSKRQLFKESVCTMRTIIEAERGGAVWLRTVLKLAAVLEVHPRQLVEPP